MIGWADVLDSRATWTVVESECLAALKTMPDNCVDAIVTDPPSGIAFMNAQWDTNKGGRDKWIAWLTEILAECRRVLKPGGHAFVWALPRTSHWTGMAIELAGFEVRDSVLHLFSTGFPKSMDISKAIDREAGVEREIVGQRVVSKDLARNGRVGDMLVLGEATSTEIDITTPVTDEAKEWDGWGTSLKPSYEVWWLCRKPLAAPTIAQNVLQWQTGGLNIAATRVGTSDDTSRRNNGTALGMMNDDGWQPKRLVTGGHSDGRWPPNCVFSHTVLCQRVGELRVKSASPSVPQPVFNSPTGKTYNMKTGEGRNGEYTQGYADPDGFEVVEEYVCAPECPVQELDRQSGVSKSNVRQPTGRDDRHASGFTIHRIDSMERGHNDDGAASRFFPCFEPDLPDFPFKYQSKPSQSERNKGLNTRKRRKVNDGRPSGEYLDNPYQRGSTLRLNVHPTVKSTSLMQWLCRLITPPNGIVLDCFAGSGSTGIAALREGFRFIGVEMNPEYVSIARQRIAEDSPLFNRLREVTE